MRQRCVWSCTALNLNVPLYSPLKFSSQLLMELTEVQVILSRSPILKCSITYCLCYNISPFPESSSDYGALRRHSLRFRGCGLKDCVNVSITDDLELEMVESFNISLEKSQGLSNKFLLAPGHREVIIIDNDGMYHYNCCDTVL